MVIIGAGVIGLEFASLFSKLGTKIFVVEFGSAITPALDNDVKSSFTRDLETLGVEQQFESQVTGIAQDTNTGLVTVEGEWRHTREKFEMTDLDAVLVATGRRGNIEGIGLSNVPGIQQKKGYIVVNQITSATDVDGIYAMGDVTGGNLASIATTQAHAAVNAWRCRLDDEAYSSSSSCVSGEKPTQAPSVIWTIPGIAYVGIADAPGYGSVRVDYTEVLRGSLSSDGGFLKLVFVSTGDEQGRIAGVHIYGEAAAELIAFGYAYVNEKKTVRQVLEIMFPAVTYHELYTAAARKADRLLRSS